VRDREGSADVPALNDLGDPMLAGLFVFAGGRYRSRSHAQIQIIRIVIGTAAPTALPTIHANADSGFASAREPFPDMPLLR
jgi:hypothetical protein